VNPVRVPGAEGPPLAGLRVLDLTRLLPGPVCTLHLADLGADVVKVEDTGEGDYGRGLGARPGRPSAFYAAVNRNKRSLAIDLKDPRGRDAFLALAAKADVVVESFRPGVMAKLGLGYDVLAGANPALVFASITGYGQDGPRRDVAGHDVNFLAYAGVLDQIGTRDGAPALSNLQIADLLGGAASAAIAILACLVGARASGRGRAIDVAMADATLAHNIFALHALEQHGRTMPRGRDLLTGGVPCYGVYPTADGRWLAVAALEDKFWRVLCKALARPDLLPAGLAQGEAGERARAELEAIFRGATLAEWTARLRDVDCCVTPCLTLEEALADDQYVARGMPVRATDGSRQFAPPFKVSGHAFTIARLAPAQGEHSVAVLREAGLADAAIDALARAGVVRTPA
jgi:crotonobetainyl-CoA:carnitine CoA-transferase CaiB-like acyl-CoA transferase